MGGFKTIQPKEMGFGWSGALLIIAVGDKGCSDAVWQKGWGEIVAEQSKSAGWRALLIFASKKSSTKEQQKLVERSYAAKMRLPEAHRTALITKAPRKKADWPKPSRAWWSKSKVLLHSFVSSDVDAALKWLSDGATFDTAETKATVAKLREQVKV